MKAWRLIHFEFAATSRPATEKMNRGGGGSTYSSFILHHSSLPVLISAAFSSFHSHKGIGRVRSGA
jgi:hypothetical protein